MKEEKSCQTQPVDNRLALKAGILYLVAEFLTRGISFMTTPIFTRLLPQAVFADAKIYESWVYLFAPIISLSLYQSVARAKFDYKEHYGSYLSDILAFMMCLTLGLLVVCLPFSVVLSKMLGYSKLLLLLMLAYCLAYNSIQCVQLYDRQLMNYRRNIALTVLGVIPGLLTALTLVVLFRGKVSEATLLNIRIVGFFLPTTLIGLGLSLRLMVKERTFYNKEHWHYASKYSAPLIAAAVASQIFFQSSTIFTRKMIGAEAAAIVALAMTVGYIMDILIHAIDNAWKPWMFEQLNAGQPDLVRQFWRFLFSGTALLIWIITIIAPELTLFLGGTAYEKAVVLICPILCASLANFLMIGYTALEQYYKKTRVSGYASILAAVFNLVMNYVFIRLFGYQAVVYTTAAAYLLACMIHYAFVRKFEKDNVLQAGFSFVVMAGTFSVCLLSTKLYGLTFLARGGLILIILFLCALLARRHLKQLFLIKEMRNK